MRDAPSYAPPTGLGEVMTGGVTGRVVESKSPKFQAGDIVTGQLGWQEYAVAAATELRKVESSAAPISTSLGVLGMPGLTACFGLLDICDPQPGETLLVNGAAGAVGSIVGQIGKIRGCRVVGVAGSDEKVRHVVEDLGFDAAFNYKSTRDYAAKYRELCPAGIDCYFDNVGGPLTDAVFPQLTVGARVSVCGQISQYNEDKAEMVRRWLFHLVIKRARVQGFLVFDYASRYDEGLAQLGDWLREGKIRYRETVAEGLENAPAAFLGMMRGENIGKQLVKLAD
jgi:NADPH-dependent curcumin reductase CurA